MNNYTISLKIITSDKTVFQRLFNKNKIITLTDGLTIKLQSQSNKELDSIINASDDLIKNYNSDIGITLISNIIAAWLVYQLTGKQVNLRINKKEIPLRKTLIRNLIEDELRSSNLFKNH
jgi:hypothetical protein